MMGFFELDNAIYTGIETFKSFITAQIDADENFLEHSFVTVTGTQLTVLDYLISKHDQTNADMSLFIQELLEGREVQLFSSGQPLHWAIKNEKFDLFELMLKRLKSFANGDEDYLTLYLNSYDNEGHSLLSRVMDLQNEDYLTTLLENKLNLSLASFIETKTGPVCMQPLHQAVFLNFPVAIARLIELKALASNPCGENLEPPILLAAKLGHIEAMIGLIHSLKAQEATNPPLKTKVLFNQKDKKGERAIDKLCQQLKEKREVQATLKGIAVLLCHGTKEPSREDFRQLIHTHRDALLSEIIRYSNENPGAALEFVRKCHDRNKWKLHQMIYQSPPAVSFFPSFDRQTAVKLESLMTAENEATADEINFAKFIEAYFLRFEQKKLANPWSKMAEQLARGGFTQYKEIKDYAGNHPNSRTAKVLYALANPTLPLDQRIDELMEEGIDAAIPSSSAPGSSSSP